MRARQGLVLFLALYGALCIATPDIYRLMDGVDLAIHEAGHVFFAPFGEFAGFLGGTLLQLLMPLAFFAHFHYRSDRFSAYVVLWWVAQSLWNVSVYVADARAQVLPLVGGGEHDWAYLLGRLELLPHDTAIAGAVRMAGVLIFGFAMVQAFFHAAAPAAPAAAPAEPAPAAEAGAEVRLP
jgi:hypothetical protein